LGADNKLVLTGVPTGLYHLEARISNENNYYNNSETIVFEILPEWYQTWWFRTLLSLLAMAIIYFIYRVRINQIKKEQQIRSKLASDLHDDLGSTMNSVKVYANLAIMEKQQEDKYLFKIKESTQDAIAGIRDIIWVLDDSKDSIEHLFSRINLFAAPLCEANNIQYKYEIADNARDYKLGQEERRNLYMILKEAVNNAIKYADAKKITINITIDKGNPVIEIKDDGKGFDITKTTEGNGLKNINRRIKEIKYQLYIQSAPSKGTAILFQKI